MKARKGKRSEVNFNLNMLCKLLYKYQLHFVKTLSFGLINAGVLALHSDEEMAEYKAKGL